MIFQSQNQICNIRKGKRMGIKRGSSNVAVASKSEDKKARYEAGLDLIQG